MNNYPQLIFNWSNINNLVQGSLTLLHLPFRGLIEYKHSTTPSNNNICGAGWIFSSEFPVFCFPALISIDQSIFGWVVWGQRPPIFLKMFCFDFLKHILQILLRLSHSLIQFYKISTDLQFYKLILEKLLAWSRQNWSVLSNLII